MATKNCIDDFMSQTIEKEAWKELSGVFPWTEQLLEKYQNEVDWEKISSNDTMIWTASILERFQNRLDWKILSWSSNKSILTAKLFERFKDRWDWSLLSENDSIRLDYELINRFIDCWNWEKLIDRYGNSDENLYGLDFLDRYKEYIPEPALQDSQLCSCIVYQRIRQIASEISEDETTIEDGGCKLYPKHYPAGIGGNR